MTRIELEMDEFGRVLIPKRVRDALRLEAGSKLIAKLDNGGLQIQAVQQRGTVAIGEDGWPLLQLGDAAALPADFDPVGDLREDRSAGDLAAWR